MAHETSGSRQYLIHLLLDQMRYVHELRHRYLIFLLSRVSPCLRHDMAVQANLPPGLTLCWS